ncbi:MAG: dihydropteroate synthase [Sciscionella sp.]
MAVVNRTPDSFYDRGATFAVDKAMERIRDVVANGADVVDIGGVKAAPGEEVTVAEEIDRTAGLVAAARAEFPGLVISVDTWRAEVGREVCLAGADVLNDAWGGYDEALAEVAAEFDVGLVCTHAGRQRPRTRPHRISYDDVATDVHSTIVGLAERAAAAGLRRERIVIDPGHDFGKNTWHSLEVTRAVPRLVATGWPVLMSLSNKDFVGESLNTPVDDRMIGTLAVTAVVAAWGARVYRVHNVRETRQTLDMISVVMGHRPPARVVRGLA